jgi:hypothetical protein
MISGWKSCTHVPFLAGEDHKAFLEEGSHPAAVLVVEVRLINQVFSNQEFTAHVSPNESEEDVMRVNDVGLGLTTCRTGILDSRTLISQCRVVVEY